MIVIPARLASSRFPNKILANINGYPMVIATANRVKSLDRVIIATNSKEVIALAKDYGYEAVLTGSHHQSGTDRINECANILKLDKDELVINVQADEPFIEPDVVQSLITRLKSLQEKGEEFIMGSCYNAINTDSAKDPNLVKVVLDDNHNAIYFSRSLVPYNRSGRATYFGHIGIYGFSKKSLKEFYQ